MSLILGLGIPQANALTVYTAGPGNLSKKLALGFERKTGIKVDLFQATTGKVMARLDAEASNPHADVLISASWDTAQDLEKRGWLLDYESPNAAHVPAMFKGPSYVAQGISALGIVWNTRTGKPEPKWIEANPAEKSIRIYAPAPASRKRGSDERQTGTKRASRTTPDPTGEKAVEDQELSEETTAVSGK